MITRRPSGRLSFDNLPTSEPDPKPVEQPVSKPVSQPISPSGRPSRRLSLPEPQVEPAPVSQAVPAEPRYPRVRSRNPVPPGLGLPLDDGFIPF